MPRPSRSRALRIWANGHHVGEWRIAATGPMELEYDRQWIRSVEGRPLSLSLPFNLDGQPQRGDRVRSFFDNLLPDSDAIRQRVRDRFHTTTSDAFDLLAAIGRDCVGALQLLPEGATPPKHTVISASPIDDGAIEKLLRATVSGQSLPGQEDDFRISIAGAQEKTALTWHNERWCSPHGATPTTHIFKLPLGRIGATQMDMRSSVENEWLCGELLRGFGVPVASSEIHVFGTTKVLVVKRFDRALHPSGTYWLRLPQEDFCQATGTPPSRKYEADGGPGLADIARILQGSETRDEDLATLFRAQLLFWMLAATDGHAKNFSLRLLAAGRYRLTPLYDVVSAWPIVGGRADQVHTKKLKLAMALRGKHTHYRVSEIDGRHFVSTAKACGFDGMKGIFDDIVEKTEAVVAEVSSRLPPRFPGDLFDVVTTGLKSSAAAVGRTLR